MSEVLDYKKELVVFEDLMAKAVAVSDKSGGINTSALGIEATKVFTRLTLSAMTINVIFPNNTPNHHNLWDYPSIAVLTRTFMETTHRYLYICGPHECETEQDFRTKVYFHHLNSERYKLRRDSDSDKEVLKEFEEKLAISKERLIQSNIYQGLPTYMQKKIRSGNADMHLTDEEIANSSGLSSGSYRSIYRMLSNHSHGAPFSTTSQSNKRGRGFENDAEKDCITLCLLILNRYLSKTIVSQIALLGLHEICKSSFKTASLVLENEKI